MLTMSIPPALLRQVIRILQILRPRLRISISLG